MKSDQVSTTDPDLTRKPIPEEQRDYFVEEVGVYCHEKNRYIYSQIWKCYSCEDNFVSRFGSKCPSCVGRLRRKRPFERAFNKARCDAPREKSSGVIEWRLTYEQFVDLCLIPDCDYCGVFLNRAEYEGDGGTIAMLLDRKDSNGHYTVENCVPCCPTCNSMKGEFLTYREMHRIMAERRGEEYEKAQSLEAG